MEILNIKIRKVKIMLSNDTNNDSSVPNHPTMLEINNL